jgi:hypothetical protein
MSRHAETGFSYLDVLIAMTILLVGILSLAAALTTAMVRTGESEQLIRAKQFATSAVESLISAHDIAIAGAPLGTNDPLWDQIRNVANGGVFLDGAQAVRTGEGGDGIFGTADDTGAIFEGFTRTIVIEDQANPLYPTRPVSIRKVTVTINYKIRNIPRSVQVQTYIGNY